MFRGLLPKYRHSELIRQLIDLYFQLKEENRLLPKCLELVDQLVTNYVLIDLNRRGDSLMEVNSLPSQSATISKLESCTIFGERIFRTEIPIE